MNTVKLQDIKLIHRNPLHSYTLTMRKQKDIKETILFTIATKRIKYLGINLPKETKDLYKEKTHIKKTIKQWWKKSKKTLIDGEIYRVHRSEKSI